jgi:glycosyltransferase involved in cell wall biosynthesis
MSGSLIKIKIAYVIDQLKTGGTERQLKFLIDGLDRDRFDVTLFLLRGIEEHLLRPQNADVKTLGVFSLMSLDGFKKLFNFSGHLRENKFDIIQTFFQDATIFGVLAGKLAGVRHIFISVRDMRFWATPVQSAVHRIMTRLADALVVNSTAVQKNVKPLSGKKPVHVIYNGMPLGMHYNKSSEAKRNLAAELNIDENIPIVVLVSNCNRSVKRVDLLIESLPIVSKEADAFFLVVGDGHLRPALEARARELNVQNHIRFLGQRPDVEDILAGSDIALNTSDSEGLSNSVIEAMRAGLPVIASDVEGNSELIEDNLTGCLFSAGKHEELAKQIVYLLKNPEVGEKLGATAGKWVEERFSVAEMIENYSRFYQSACA